MIKAVIFDFDMTLVDSSYAITEGMNAIAQAEGLRELTREEVLGLIGMPIEESLEMIWGRFDEKWLTSYRNTFRESEYSNINPFPNTAAILEELTLKNIKTGIASNRAKVREAVTAVGLMDFMDFAIGLEDVENAKPAPDLVLLGVQLAGAHPSECIYVGDTEADMQSAAAAGVRGVGMVTGNCTHDILKTAGAWKTLDDVNQLLEIIHEEERETAQVKES